MTIALVLQRLAAVNELIATAAGGADVPAEPPRALSPGNLPVFVTVPGKTLKRTAEQACQVRVEREYHVRLYACSVQQGTEGEAMALCLPFFDLVPNEYDSRPYLVIEPAHPDPPTGLKRCNMTRDSGLAVMPWGNAAYLGVEWVLTVLTWEASVKAAGN